MTQVQRLLDPRGRTIIERRGVRRASVADDAYHLLRTASWWRIVTLFALLFLVSNLVFAGVLYLGGGQLTNAHGFLDYFWFSVQTIGTIGYGVLAPADHFANVIVTIESFYSLILTALITGIFFARFSTPSARVLFSQRAIIGDFDGQRALQFRMANERTTAIVEATVHAYLTREERLASGEVMRRVYDLPLRRATSPVFALSFLAVHPIDARSPLHGVTSDQLRDAGTNIIVTFTGIDDQLATNVHARYVWNWNDLVFEHRFVDLFKVDAETGARYIDLEPLHETVPLQ